MKLLPDLFLSFAKIGAFTFGGGYAMLALIEEHCVDRRKWITHEEMMDVIAIAESTPGPVAINCASYVGYRQAGLPGAALATLGVVLPSFVVILAVAMFFDNFLEITWIANAFKGIKIAVGLLILRAGIQMLAKMEKKWLSMTILTLCFAVLLAIDIFAWSFSSMWLLVVSGAVGLAAYGLRSIRKGGRP